MKKFFIIFALLLISSVAQAQSQRNPCIYLSTANTNCVAVGTSVSGVGNSPMPVGGLATAAAPTFTEGLVGALSFDLGGNVRTISTPSSSSSVGLTAISSSALAANTVVKASAGNLYSFQVSADSTLSAAAWWIMIYNATSAPVDGAVTPLKCYAMASGITSFSAAFPTPVAFSTGITIGVSTTGCFTKTASTHAFISGDAQ